MFSCIFEGVIIIMNNLRLSAKLTCILLLLSAVSSTMAQSGDSRQKAEQILKATGIKGGLIVHIGCGDGKLTSALCANESCLVHGLQTDVEKLRQARKYVQTWRCVDG
jgi:predicted RNA methylase